VPINLNDDILRLDRLNLDILKLNMIIDIQIYILTYVCV
jgi:hypothetical protein